MPLVLLIVDLPAAYRQRIADRYELACLAPGEIAPDNPLCRRAAVVWTNGMVGLSDAAMAALPALEIIVCQGVGHDGVDRAAAQRRGIPVVAGRGVNSTTVADHAMALLLSLLRRVPHYDRCVRDGQWLAVRELEPVLTGRRVGILGFGRIGRLIERRLQGFDCEIVYHARRPAEASAAGYAASPIELAERCELLVLCCPGGPATHHLVDAAVLEALGPNGCVVNVARGSVVDTEALVTALENGRIAGAALDVIEGEPDVPAACRTLPNLICTPHVGGLSAVAFDEMVTQGLASLAAHFAGDDSLPGQVTP